MTNYTNDQFSKTYYSLISKLGLTESAFYGLLADRYQSSLRNQDKFSDENGVYIIYPIEELRELTQFSKGKIRAIFSKLKQAGYIDTKCTNGRANRIYLPLAKADERETGSKIERVPGQKLTPNQSNLNQTNNINTVNTAQAKTKKPAKTALWKQAVIGKVGLSEHAVDEIIEYTKSDLKQAYEIVKLITNARNSVVRESGLKQSPATQFETNANIKQTLGTKLKYLFNYLPAKFEEQARYMTTALKNYFKQALGVARDEYVRPQVEGSNGTINKQAPAWMKEEYDPQADKLSEEGRASVKALLDDFYARAN